MGDVLCLHARAGAHRYPGSEGRVLERLGEQFPSRDITLLVCDTEYDAASAAPEPWRVLDIRTSDREFGAWHVAASELAPELRRADAAVMTTAAFDKQYSSYLELMTEQWCELLPEATAIGHIDYYNDPVMIDGIASQFWLRTSYVMLSGFLVPEALGAALPLPDDEDLFSDDPAQPLVGDFLSDSYKTYLISWLTGEGTGQGVRWHSSKGLDADGLQEFRSKVRSILREHLFTLHLLRLGATVWDATYLSAADDPDRTLGWRKQLAARPRDAAVIDLQTFSTELSRRRHARAARRPEPVGGTLEPVVPARPREVPLEAPQITADYNLSSLQALRSQALLTTYVVDSPYIAGTDPRTPLVLALTHPAVTPRGNWLDLMVNAFQRGQDVHVADLVEEGGPVDGLHLLSSQVANGLEALPESWDEILATVGGTSAVVGFNVGESRTVTTES